MRSGRSSRSALATIPRKACRPASRTRSSTRRRASIWSSTSPRRRRKRTTSMASSSTSTAASSAPSSGSPPPRPTMPNTTRRPSATTPRPAATWSPGIATRPFRSRLLGPDGTPITGETAISAVQEDIETEAIAYSSVSHEYLVVWKAFNDGRVYAQRLNQDAGQVGIDDEIVGGSATLTVDDAVDVAYNATSLEYMVVFNARPNGSNNEEVYGQRLDLGGNQVGADDFPISEMGPPGDTSNTFTPRRRASSGTRRRTSTWSPGTATTAWRRSPPMSARSSASCLPPTAPRSGPTTSASPTWGRTATPPPAPSARGWPTTRSATSTSSPGTATRSSLRSSTTSSRSTASTWLPTAPRSATTTSASPTSSRTATRNSRPTGPPSPTTR